MIISNIVKFISKCDFAVCETMDIIFFIQKKANKRFGRFDKEKA